MMAVRLETLPDRLCATTMTSQAQAQAASEAEIIDHGMVTVSGAALAERISALTCDPDDEVQLASSDDSLIVTAGNVVFEVRFVPVSETDFIDYDEKPNHVTVGPDFAEQLKLAEFAASTDPGRGVLCGIQVSEFGMVSTDHYRFIMIEQELAGVAETVVSRDLIKMFPDPDSYGDGDLSIWSSPQEVELCFGAQYRLQHPSLVGQYPDVHALKEICPTDETPHQFQLDVAELKTVLVSAAPYYGATTGASIHPNGDLRLVTPDGEQFKMQLESADVQLPTPVTFNISFLKNVERLVKDEDTCIFRFHDEKPDAMPFTISKDNVLIGMQPMRHS